MFGVKSSKVEQRCVLDSNSSSAWESRVSAPTHWHAAAASCMSPHGAAACCQRSGRVMSTRSVRRHTRCDSKTSAPPAT